MRHNERSAGRTAKRITRRSIFFWRFRLKSRTLNNFCITPRDVNDAQNAKNGVIRAPAASKIFTKLAAAYPRATTHFLGLQT